MSLARTFIALDPVRKVRSADAKDLGELGQTFKASKVASHYVWEEREFLLPPDRLSNAEDACIRIWESFQMEGQSRLP